MFVAVSDNLAYFIQDLGNHKPVYGFYMAVVHLMAADTAP